MSQEFPIAVLISGEGTNLQALLDDPDIDVAAVAASKEGARGLERARDAGVETAVFAIGDHAGRDERDQALGDWMDERGARLVVLAGFMEILGVGFIRRFAGRIVNVHPSLLPAFPGVRAIEQALEHGVKLTGVTVHFVDEGVDSGPIVLQEALELTYSRPVEDVEASVHEVEHRLLPKAVRLIAAGRVVPDPDNPRLMRIEDAGND
ncbi:MAG TPA: phosphoribosylglycinamide formyltransferase [Thermoleophilaceae bacterium]